MTLCGLVHDPSKNKLPVPAHKTTHRARGLNAQLKKRKKLSTVVGALAKRLIPLGVHSLKQETVGGTADKSLESQRPGGVKGTGRVLCG